MEGFVVVLIIAVGLLSIGTLTPRTLDEATLVRVDIACNANQGIVQADVSLLNITIICKDSAVFTIER